MVLACYITWRISGPVAVTNCHNWLISWLWEASQCIKTEIGHCRIHPVLSFYNHILSMPSSATMVTIPEVRRYRSYEEPDETPNRGARFGSWLPHVMWYFVSQQRRCKWVFVWTLQRSMKFQTRRRRDLHQQAQTNGVVKHSTMGVRAHETPNQGAQFGKCWHWPVLLPPQLAS